MLRFETLAFARRGANAYVGPNDIASLVGGLFAAGLGLALGVAL